MTGSGLRVGIVAPSFAPFRGGVETYVATAASALAGEGVDVTVITQVPKSAGLPRDSVRDGYAVERHVLPVADKFDVPSVAAATAASRPGRFDVLWLHNYHSPLAWLVAERTRCPIVFTPHYHGVGHTPLRRALHVAYRPAGRRIMTASRRVVAVTEAEAALLHRDFPRELRQKVAVIPTAVPDPLDGHPPIHNAPNMVLTVARQEPYKRTDLLIRAISRLRQRQVSARLVVIGDGAALAASQHLVDALELKDMILFTGAVDDETLTGNWAAASMYASASEQEAYGIGVAQALVAGLPVAASDIPAHRELVQRAGSHAAARLCDLTGSDDETAGIFADAIAELLTDAGSSSDRSALCTLPRTSDMVQQLLHNLSEVSDMVRGS